MKKCKNCKFWAKLIHDLHFYSKDINGVCERMTGECINKQLSKGDAWIESREAAFITDQNFYCSKFKQK
jgi:hypothetical protein